jgi:hypothetical protein
VQQPKAQPVQQPVQQQPPQQKPAQPVQQQQPAQQPPPTEAPTPAKIKPIEQQPPVPIQQTIVPRPTQSTKPKWDEHLEESPQPELQSGPKVQVCDWTPEHQEITPVASSAKSTYKPNQIQLEKAWPPVVEDDS